MFNVPILVRVIQQALEAVPRDQRDAALALGLTRWEATVHVLIPCACPASLRVYSLAGRVFGEAAALIYTAGQSAPALDFSHFDLASTSCPWNVFRPAETLAVHIWRSTQKVCARPRGGVGWYGCRADDLRLAFHIIARMWVVSWRGG